MYNFFDISVRQWERQWPQRRLETARDRQRSTSEGLGMVSVDVLGVWVDVRGGGGAGGATRCDVVALGCQNGSAQVPFVVEGGGSG